MSLLPIENRDLQINALETTKAARVYRAINHHLRQQILVLLHSSKKMQVTAIYAKLNLEQSVTSQHLGILREAKLVKTERVGKKVFYSINYARLKDVHQKAREILVDPN